MAGGAGSMQHSLSSDFVLGAAAAALEGALRSRNSQRGGGETTVLAVAMKLGLRVRYS